MIGVFLAAAGCGTPGPRDEEILLTDAQERVRRDVLALRYSEGEEGTRVSIVVTRGGEAEVRSELGTRGKSGLVNALVREGSVPRRQRRVVPVTSGQRDEIVARFAALPAGTSEWTMPLVIPKEEPRTSDSETEVQRPDPVTVRMLLVSRTGEVQTVIVYRGGPKGASASAKPGGEAVSALEKSFQALFLPAK